MRIFLLLFITLAACTQQSNRQNNSKATAVDSTLVIQEGQQITQTAFSTLSSNLQRAIAEGGIPYALQFCNVEAMPLTDSLSTAHNVMLKRASHRPRNPRNRADSLEMTTIKKYLQQINQQKELAPQLYTQAQQIIYHAPIRINQPLCLNCHGQLGSDITQQTLDTLRQQYPEDEATGFAMGDLRGIWTIKFPGAYFDKGNN